MSTPKPLCIKNLTPISPEIRLTPIPDEHSASLSNPSPSQTHLRMLWLSRSKKKKKKKKKFNI
jgi:hypothetical protein